MSGASPVDNDALLARLAAAEARAVAAEAGRVDAEKRAAANAAALEERNWQRILQMAATFSTFREAMTQRGDSRSKSLGRVKSWDTALVELRRQHGNVDKSVIDESFNKYWRDAFDMTNVLNANKSVDEVAHVHPVGRVFVDAVARCAAKLCLEKGTLVQYNENAKMPHRSVPSLTGSVLSRNPDGAVLVTRVGVKYDRLDRQTQRDVVVSFEFKRKLECAGARFSSDKAYKEACDEVFRDYAHTLPDAMPMPGTELHYGFGVVSDGVR